MSERRFRSPKRSSRYSDAISSRRKFTKRGAGVRKLGFVILREGKHIIMSDGAVRLVIPRNNPINPYTMGALARAAGLSPEEFKALL